MSTSHSFGAAVASVGSPHLAGGPPAHPLESALRSVQDELIACQRLALLGSLAAMAAHEFNNLMTPILARVEVALSSPGDTAFVRKTLERTLTHSQRAIALSRQILDLAQHGKTPPGSCHLAAAVREAIATAARPFEKDNIALRVDVAEDLRVACSEDFVVQLVLNLILNARTAMKEHGGALEIKAVAAGQTVSLSVRDTGVGMSTAHIDSVINPFLDAEPFARPNDWQSVGLGLSVCRMIAHRHGARLRAAANDGAGCTFQVDWPRAGADA